ncbi:diguanylate cyclase/phosphodiesterase with PAS/PAC and Chase sensor(s) [Thiocapsa marina 5811]|uniref:Diguanylate cyclase/phosphodiesterase with PAS/PAC and Chase sensor(S) n=1 Tax=Thiocapsa marina 5811 TaxID=768671 RepID=F9U7L2_9GAMM|nr:diguanylate cyclase/phosphodiesterase with PAS/PAC and Chase sensor(s) [Thiocapsa marina 5811]
MQITSKEFWLAWVVLGCGLLATLFVGAQVKQGIEADAVRQFAFDCDQVTLKIRERLGAYALILRGGAALFAASGTVDRQEWRLYVETLRAQDSLPGVQGVGFAQVIAPDQLAGHLARIRAEGFPDYRLSPPGERASYTAIIYLEPFRDRNLRAFGYDMFSEPVRRTAMEQARDTGEAALSGKVKLVQETAAEVQAGTLMYVPVYRNGWPLENLEQRRAAIFGWSYSPYRMNDLMIGILGDWTHHEGQSINLRIHDGALATPETLLFDSLGGREAHASPARRQQVRHLDFNGHRWLLVFEQTSRTSGIRDAWVWATLSGGLVLSGLLFGLMLSVVNTRASIRIAHNLADRLQRREQLLEESRQALADVLDNASIHIWAFNGIRYSYLNKAFYDFTGIRKGQELTLETWANYVHPDDLASAGAVWQAAYAAKAEHDNYFRLRNTRGEYRDFWCHAVPIFHRNGEFFHFQGFNVDITDRKQAESRLRLAASVFTHASEGIMITTAEGTIIDVNDAFTRITSYAREDVLGRNPRLLSSGRQGREFYASMWRTLIENGRWSGEIWNRRKNGEVYAEMQTISAVRDALGSPQHYVALFSDITALKEHQRQLEHIAHYDALTSLPNRVLLSFRLLQAMAQTKRRAQRLAVAYLDLDGFKAINDTHGHETGDQLLMIVAGRMKQCLREGDTLARLGGDEFVAVLVDLGDDAGSVPMLTRLLMAASQPVPVDGLSLQVSASIGVTFYPQSAEVDADQLLRQADQAMYRAKLSGKNRYSVFDAAEEQSIRGHHANLERLSQALAEHEFVLHYQPKVNMRTGAVIGVEALIRWQHPERGLLAPALFLPAIENHPLAVEVGEWVIETALTQMDDWLTGGLELPISVNIGARQLRQADFAACLNARLLAHPDRAPNGLELELLETSAQDDLVSVSKVIDACREIGVHCAMDDFGTGYSSLTCLKRLAVSLLKVDQGFVRDMLDDPGDLAIVESVLGLAAAFHHEVLAEGVESLEHGEILLQLGCELAQGYVIARPMPGESIPPWVRAWRPDRRWTRQPPLRREEIPLLFAIVEHRAWMHAFENHWREDGPNTPPLDFNHCHLAQWIALDGNARYGAQPIFQSIARIHRQLHESARELLDNRAKGDQFENVARLETLRGFHASLLEQMRQFLDERCRQAP